MMRSHPTTSPRRRGFTVIELVVVISIIVLALGLAVPAFNALTGSNNENSASNQIASMLGRARSEAIGLQEIRGVCFYPNTAGRYFATLVHAPSFDSYVTATSYTFGQYCTSGTNYYVCTADHVSSGGTPAADGGYWVATDAYAIDSILPDADSVTLPANVGVQVVCDSKITAGVQGTDKYLKVGAVLFDASGQVVFNHQISIAGSGILGQKMGLTSGNPSFNYPGVGSPCLAIANPHYEGSCGFVLFDRDALASQPSFTNPDNDWAVIDPRYPQAQKTNEFSGTNSKELWLDNNAQIYLINRYNGSLIKGQ